MIFNAIQIAATSNSMAKLPNPVSPSFLGYPIVTTPVMTDNPSATYNRFYWCRREESNLRPTDYESVALPTELHRLFRLCTTSGEV